MLTILNHYQHGFVAIPVVLACKQRGLFALCQQATPLPFEALVRELRANSGHLRVALHLLRAMQWLSHDDHDRYTLTPAAALHRHIPADVTDLLSYRMPDYIHGRDERLSLGRWVELSGRRWDIQDQTLALFLDGLLMIPLLLALRERALSHGKDLPRASLLATLPAVACRELVTLFAAKGWLAPADGPSAVADPVLNDAGRFIIGRSLITAAVASYRPMLTNIATVLFGDCASVFGRDAAGHETHVDRTLNVVGSGFQHQRYFEHMEESLLAVFNRQPIEEQPRYVADMGCGDGTLLRKIYDLVKARSLRGQALERYPLTLIGVDYNEQALKATARTLEGYDHLILPGDIGAPARLIEDLGALGVHDPERILHVRSFLDHDRPYRPPVEPEAVQARAHMPYSGVYVDRQGHSLPPAAVVQSLVEHLRRWSDVVGRHGLLMLEVHCLAPTTIARFVSQCESLHMDAYHRFSQQLLVEAEHCIMAAAEVGLFPDWQSFRQFPPRQPYTRITLSHLRKRDYTIRHAHPSDAPALVALEQRCLPAPQVASLEGVARRLAEYPAGQCLLEVGGQLVAAAYAQRVSSVAEQSEVASMALPAWTHTAAGPVVELLYAVCPEPQHKPRGQDLLRFMGQCLALQDGVESVTGGARCERYLELTEAGRPGLSPAVRDHMQCYPIGPEAETRAPEAALSAFAMRWLLRVFQDMGALTPHQVYVRRELPHSLGVLPKYERLCAALLRLLARQGALHLDGERVELTPLGAALALQDVEADSARFAADFRQRYPALQPWLELTYRCLSRFTEVLTGRVEAIDVVFPEGAMETFAGLFQGHAVADYFNSLVAEIVLDGVTSARQRAPKRRIAVLEVGAGTGSTTAVVVERIQHLREALSFDYTDLSSAFTRYGERTLGQRFPWLRFARLNIEADPIPQGFQPQSFDIIYAANALHDTRRIAEALDRVKALLTPGGLLILNEFTAMKDVLLLSGGLLTGYWLFEDPELRLPDSCLLSAERWCEALTAAGFEDVTALGLPFEEAPGGQSVIICHKPVVGAAAREKAGSLPSEQGHTTMVEDALREILGPERLAALAPDTPLMESGMDSMELLDLRLLLSKRFDTDLDVTFLFQQNTLRKVREFFQQRAHAVRREEPVPPQRGGVPVASIVSGAGVPSTVRRQARQGDIAVIGVALRLPGGIHTLDDFWRLLHDGVTVVGALPAGRRLWPSGPGVAPGKAYLGRGGFLPQIDAFDAAFFRISRREAELMDPQQRLLLELGWEVMEDAGYRPSVLSGSDTGVFVGACHFDYRRLLEGQGLSAEALAATGTSASILANRLSYFYNLQGPSLVLDTACSSSLVAVHEAVRALRDGACEQALVGGINLICHPAHSVSYDQAGMLSRDGACFSFDARANGYVRGEGAALIFLKPLNRAVQDQDSIYAVIKGSAVNHGGQASSLTAPNPEAQARLLLKAWQDAGISPDSVTYIEAHGTGTPLGDPIEVEGIRQAFAGAQPAGALGHTCGLGSVKANVGHLEGAAGIAGLLKVLLCLRRRTLPRSVNFQTLNPEITLAPPLYIVDRSQPWPAPHDDAGEPLPRRAGVSAFGFGGANAHVVLEEFDRDGGEGGGAVAGPYVFVLSARDPDRLLVYAERFVAFLQRPQAQGLSLAGITYTLQHCREEMDERLAILCADLTELCDRLRRFCAGEQRLDRLYHGNAQRSAAEYALLTDGAAGHTFVEALLREKDYERLALLWIRGAHIAWPTLCGGRSPERVHLPTYPFAQERYWLPSVSAEGATPTHTPGASTPLSRRERAGVRGAQPCDRPRTPSPSPLPAGEGMKDLSTPAAALGHGRRDGHTLLLTPVWVEVDREQRRSGEPFPAAAERLAIVVVEDQQGEEGGVAYCQALRRRYPGAQRLLVRPEDDIDGIAQRLKELASQLGGPLEHLFWVAPASPIAPATVVGRDLLEAQRQGLLPLFRLIKALLRSGYGQQPLGWTAVTTRAQPVLRREHVDPAPAGVHGLFGSLAKEFPHWKIRLIDVDEPPGAAVDPWFHDLLTQPSDPEGDAWAYRWHADGRRRWFRQQLVPIALPAQARSRYRTGGVYVVVGGAGGLGEAWSEYMLRTYAARLVWIGRRPLDATIQAKLDRLARLGPAPCYIAADAGDVAALRRAREEIRRRYGRIDGIVHAALVLLDQGLANMDEARFRAGLAAKVDTSVQMAQVFQREPLDFILFFSSIMTFLKAPGQSNYAAGCVFQDALAHQLGRQWSWPQGGPAVKVMNWGYWGGVGVVASAAYRERMARAGFASIDPAEAMAALESLLAGSLDRLVLVKTVQPATAQPSGASPFFRLINAAERVSLVPDARMVPALPPLPPGEGQGEGSPSAVISLSPSPHPSPEGRGGQAPSPVGYPPIDSSPHPSPRGRGSQDAPLADRILAEVLRAAAEALGVEPADLDADVDLHEYGFDVVSLAYMTRQLSLVYGLDGQGLDGGLRPLHPDDVLQPQGGQGPTLRALAASLLETYGEALRQTTSGACSLAPTVPVTDEPRQASATAPQPTAVDAVAFATAVIRTALSRCLKTPAADIDGDVPFSEYGLDSILTAGFVVDLNDRLGIAMNQAIVFDHTTVNRLAAHVVQTYGPEITRRHGSAAAGLSSPRPPGEDDLLTPDASGRASLANGQADHIAPVGQRRRMPRLHVHLTNDHTSRAAPSEDAGTGRDGSLSRATDIAVIGMAGQFPDAGDVHKFWENLLAGRDCVHELPAHYLDQTAYFSAERRPGKTYSRWGGIVQERDCFDPLFFNISPREARSMSPHQRLILQESWKALEDAGYNPKGLAGRRVGVFIGAEPAGYFHETFTGASDALIASRLSYHLNLRGPALVVNTGCSSSGVAIHLACDSLRHGEADLALTGGVFVLTDAALLVQLCAMDMLSPSGRCHTFDARGDGMVVSEGVGIVALKRLAEAIADGDPILGVICASGVNQDGASNGITAPNGAAQEELITSVYERFRIDARDIGYVEAHGTGTRLGDPVEANALVRAFRRFTEETGFCALGSVKAAIGHTAASAGVVGLIKVLLSFKHGMIPGLVGLERLNPLIALDDTPFYVSPRPQPWRAADGKPRLAALNCFGHSGTNVHLVLREHAPALPSPTASGGMAGPAFVPLSARNMERLRAYAESLRWFLTSPIGRDVRLADVAYTLQVGREAMQERALFLVRDVHELVSRLRDFAAGMPAIDGCWVGRADRAEGATQLPVDAGGRRDLAARWLAGGEYDKLAVPWTRGADLDWHLLYAEEQARGRRINLPPYPFAKERYWRTDTSGVAAGAVPPSRPHRPIPADERPDQPGPTPAGEETVPPVVHAISAPLPVDEARLAHILTHGELLSGDLDGPLCRLLWGTFQAMGLGREGHLRPSDFEASAGIDRKYGRWVEESLNILVAMGYLDREGGCFRVRDGRPIAMEVLWQEWERSKTVWAADARIKLQVALVDATLRFLPQILTGAQKVTDCLFPNASMELVEGVYRHNLVADFFNEALADVLVAYLRERLRRLSPGAVLGVRLLEIGAGTGGTTAVILPRLKPFLPHIREYCYTDVSRAFLNHARQCYAPEHPFLTTRIFDMEAPTDELNFDLGAYDVVIATNVIHASRNVRQPVRNARALLKPHGLLLLNELSRKPRPLFIHLSLALLDGWWLYEDPELRIQGCPGLFPHTWERVLREEGFGSVFFPVEQAHVLGQQIVIAEKDRGRSSSQREAGGVTHQWPTPPLPPGEGGGEGSWDAAPARGRPHPDPLPGGEGQASGDRIEEHVRATIIAGLGEALELDTSRVDVEAPFADYGLDSIMAINLVQVLNRSLRLDRAAQPLTTTTLFDHSSVDQLTAHIAAQYGPAIAATLGDTAVLAADAGHARSAPASIDVSQPSTRPNGPGGRTDAIAVVGMSGRFPGSETLDAFWQHLITGTDLVTEVSRWDLAPYFPEASPGRRPYCRHGGFLEHVDRFDPLFFKISALEATYMDPQQRIFLEESWKALEDAGYAGEAVRGQRCGVYVGCVGGDYAKLFRSEPPEQAFWGNAASITPARIAYYLDLQGPAVAVDTACSSSAVALHLACQALRAGEIDMALAGGVYVQSTPELFVSGGRAGMLSPTGRCFTFDRRADGFVPGEGAGVLVLKRLGDALADGDHIHGVIRGSGLNQDGTTNGITAPSAKSQERLIRQVYDRFGVDPERIQMVEAHGTGTILGDPIEVEALTRAFRHYTERQGYCALGTLKTNIGHTSMAAGVAGVLKILLALKHRQIPPSLNYVSANPRLALEHSPFYVNTQPRPWSVAAGESRCAATSAFGFSGTNAHLVIEEAPRIERRHAPMPGYLCALSARTAEQLRRRVEDLVAFCEGNGDADLGNVCYTLLLGRSHLSHRLACVARDLDELVRHLRAWLDTGVSPQVYVGEILEGPRRQRSALARYGAQCIQACRRAGDASEYLEHLATLADLYVQGYALDFPRLFGDGYARLPLPTYPFAREPYWVPDAALPAPLEAAAAVERLASTALDVLHPLLHRNTSDFTVQRFSSRFSGGEFFLADHRIDGQSILPGVAQLEMARAAAVAAAGRQVGRGCRVLDVIWTEPVAAGGEVHIELVPQAQGSSGGGQIERVGYTIYTETAVGRRRLHGQGTVSLSAPTTAPTLDLAAIQTRMNRERLSAGQCYEAFHARGIEHGPSLQGLEEIFRAEAQVLARLRPPATPGGFVLHPTTLDAAFQAAFFLMMEGGDGAPPLPFALAELALLAPGVTPAWAWLRRAAKTGQLDIDLCDDQGRVCLRLSGLSFRARAGHGHIPAAQTLLLTPSWEEKAAGLDGTGADRHVVVLCGMDDSARGAVEAEIPECRCLLLPALDLPIEEYFQRHAVRVFETLRELPMRDSGASILFQVVCPTQGPERLFAALAALLHIAGQESAGIVGQLIEIDPAGEDLSARLRDGSLSLEDTHIRYHQGKRYVAGWRTLDDGGREAESPWKDGGTYLITGGLGGLGMVVARDIAAQARDVTLILVGRSPLPPLPQGEGGGEGSAKPAQGTGSPHPNPLPAGEGMKDLPLPAEGEGHEPAPVAGILEELRALGARVEYRQVDVTDPNQVDDLIRHIRESVGARPGIRDTIGPLQGIIHAAGVHHDRRIVDKTAAEFMQVLAPKVAGTVNLDRATRDLDLDVFVLFSSIAVAMGNPGQADYATANAFMDAYAAWRNGLVAGGRRRGHTLSIDWPLWQEGRMRADRDIERLVTRRTGLVAMESQAGLRAMRQALASGQDRVLVLHGDASKLYAALATPRPLPDRAGGVSLPASGIPRPISAPRPVPDGAAEGSGDESLPTSAPSGLGRRALDHLRGAIAAMVQLPSQRLDVDAPLERYGFDSILLAKATNTLEDIFGALPKTLLFEHQTVRELTAYLLQNHPDRLSAWVGWQAPQARRHDPPSAVNPDLVLPPVDGTAVSTTEPGRLARVPQRQGFSAAMHPGVQEPVEADIAVIGLSGRYPQAASLDELWANLKQGRDCITEVPRGRWDHERYFDPEPGKPGKTVCKWGGFIDGVDRFDALFFNISPRDAALMDPQERLFLETVWHLFEAAGYTRERLRQRYEGKVGVFVGAMYQHYHLFASEPDGATVALSSYSAIANRVSHFFSFQGPSLAVDTMCSSSLTAVHMACQNLLRGECALAVAGGVNLSLHPKKFVGLSRAGLAASRPDSRSFGDGDGYLPAEGVGAVLLKPLVRAVSDRDEILAVIKSTAVNHGGGASGFAVPNPKAQAQLIVDNFARAGLDPRTISYVESAANGSPLGDALEMAALNTAFARFTRHRGFCAIGSVKSIIGHPEAASGMAQLTKVILQLRHGQLVPAVKPPSLNPDISFHETPFYLQETLASWHRPRLEVAEAEGGRSLREVPRRAAIDSFGAGGSNAHVIVEEYVAEPPAMAPRSESVGAPHVVVLSAKTPERLRAVARRLLDFLATAEPTPALADVAYTLQVGREAMPSRLAMVVRDQEELHRGLATFLEAAGASQAGSIPVFVGNAQEQQGVADLLASAAVRQALLDERHPEALARYWALGGEVPWEALYDDGHPRLINLPTYPFARDRYWLRGDAEPGAVPTAGSVPEPATPAPSGSEPSVHEPHEMPGVAAQEAPAAFDRAQTFLLRFLCRELHLTAEQVLPHRELREYGADSITGMRLMRAVEQELGVHLSGRDLLQYRTVHALSTYLAARLHPPLSPEEGWGEGSWGEREQRAAPDVLDRFKQGRLTLEEVEALLAEGETV